MAEIFETEEKKEKVILVAVSVNDNEDTKMSLDELEDLADTAGAVTVSKIIQNRDAFHPGTYIGKGKMDEVREAIAESGADTVVCDDELTPAQLKNLEDELQCKVLDRTAMILEIFAQRANTKEGKIQVELAQLKYRSTRLVGLRSSLSRLGGGIGTRGPGEKKLEIDRRLIKDRISILNRELSDVRRTREIARKSRSANLIPTVAIVGYTNAGKSTLLNTLTNAGVLEEDKLFATLDPTTRGVETESGQKVFLTDTVGFIRKLPHHLIDAFRSTLEEAKYADIILHVVDCSNDDFEVHMHVVYETLKQLGVENIPIITAFNKIDQCENDIIAKDLNAEKIVKISAKKSIGLDHLLDAIEEIVKNKKIYLEKVFSYEEAGKIQMIRKYGQLLTEEYQEEGIFIQAYIPNEIESKLK